jgi:hypothetical protein
VPTDLALLQPGTYPAGILSDKLRDLRITQWSTIALLVIGPLWLVFLFYNFIPTVSHGSSIGLMAIHIAAITFCLAAELPPFVRILPQSRYGQFNSANAMVCSLAIIAVGIFTGILLDRLTIVHPQKNDFYRMIPLLSLVSLGASLFFLRSLFRNGSSFAVKPRIAHRALMGPFFSIDREPVAPKTRVALPPFFL